MPGCAKEEHTSLKDRVLTIIETNSSGCKESLKSSDVDRYIELKAEGDNQLRVKFINAYLNCAGLDSTDAVINEGILKVVFIEDISANCMCYFDLECLIDSMENMTYKLEVYAHGEKPQAKLSFTYSNRLDSKIYISDN